MLLWIKQISQLVMKVAWLLLPLSLWLLKWILKNLASFTGNKENLENAEQDSAQSLKLDRNKSCNGPDSSGNIGHHVVLKLNSSSLFVGLIAFSLLPQLAQKVKLFLCFTPVYTLRGITGLPKALGKIPPGLRKVSVSLAFISVLN